jgi:hypothetical protein
MKKLFSTAAIIAALASAVPVSAQRTGPGPTANPGTGPGVFLPGGVGPSSPLDNLNEESAGLPGAASYPQRLAWVRLLEIMALFDEAACEPRSQTGSSAPSSPNGVRSVLAGGSMNDRRP